MAISYNDITDNFQKEIGRAPTPFELSKYSTAPIQDLTNLKQTYSSYKPDSSVGDYLSFLGDDPSLQNQQKYAQMYGISNYTGAYDQNQQLLAKIKQGVPGTPGFTGTVAPQNSTDTQNDQGSPYVASVDQANGVVPGSIASASGSTPSPLTPPVNDGTINTDPNVLSARKIYNDAYTAQQTAQQAVTDIDATLANVKQEKMDEISRSGGIVDEAALQSEIYRENEPLLTQRKQLVSEYTTANQNYQKALQDKTAAEADFVKQSQLNQGQEKIDNQSTQFSQKIDQSGFKSEKVNIYDPGGNVIGQKVVWTQNPGSTATDNASNSTPTSSGNGGISATGTTNVGNTAVLPKVTLADGASPQQVMQSLISGKPVYAKGSTVPLSQQDLYNLAVMDMLGSTSTVGGRTPSGDINAVKDKETQIMNAYGLTPFDVATAKQEFAGLGAANTQLLSTYAYIKTYASTANDNLNLALGQSDLVGRGGAKLVNNYTQWAAGNFTPAGDLAKFETYIYTAAREYAKVTSGGAQSSAALTDSAQSEADKLINAAQSPEVFKQVVQAMQNDMKNVTGEFEKQTSSFPDAVKALYGLASAAPALMRSSLPTGTDGDKQFVEKSLTRQGLNYNDLIGQMKSQTPPGTQPALDASTGATVFATPDDIKNGLAIPL